MRHTLAALALALAGCGTGGSDIASAEMQLSGAGMPTIAAVELLVFDGKNGWVQEDGKTKELDEQGVAEMKATGKLLDTAGLASTATSKRVRLRGGRICVVDGPFAEAKEVVGGYAMLDAQSMDEAIALTMRFVEPHVADGWEIDCEVRQVYEADFG